MKIPLLSRIDGFIQAMLVMVALALFFPSLGASDGPLHLDVVTIVGVSLVFFLHGAALSREKIVEGARNWRLYRDLEEADHYSERFIVESWLDYLRQRGRLTQNDEAQELALMRFRDGRREIKRYIYQAPVEQV